MFRYFFWKQDKGRKSFLQCNLTYTYDCFNKNPTAFLSVEEKRSPSRSWRWMFGSFWRTLTPASTRRSPLNTASLTCAECWKDWRRWRSWSPRSAMVRKRERRDCGIHLRVCVVLSVIVCLCFCRIPEAAGVGVHRSERKEDRLVCRGDRSQRWGQVAEERSGDQTFCQVRWNTNTRRQTQLNRTKDLFIWIYLLM